MEKKAFFYIDDVIWTFRDLTRDRPASLFDNPFMKVLKTAHDRYGMKVQLNVFYRTDFFYGSDEFTLADMTDAYKEEFTAASDWLKFGFHAKQEFPDYPYVNANYADVAKDLREIKREITRFAGEQSFAKAAVPHWMPISKEACQAFYDAGIKIMSVTTGQRTEYNGDPSTLPYGHAFRLLHNRKPETKLFERRNGDTAINSSICGYNHLETEQIEPIRFTFDYVRDEETGMCFKSLCNMACLNLWTQEQLRERVTPHLGKDFVSYGVHEQYFYPDYFAYQPDYDEKIYLVAKLVNDAGYEHFFAEEIVK